MSESRKGKKRPKSYYIKCAHQKRRRGMCLEAGMKGFLITCNRNEKQAVQESYSILNQYADALYGPEKINKAAESDGDSSEEDMEKAMAKEVQEYKEAGQAERRFQNVESGAKNCIFIKTTLSKPEELLHKIFTDLVATKVQKGRYALRMLPIVGTCRAQTADIEKLAQSVFEPFFRTDFGKGQTFSIAVKVRNNNGVGRDGIIPALARIIRDMNPLNTVNHSNPDFSVLVEIICSVCCLSVVRDFHKFRKYNLQEVVRDRNVGGEDLEKKLPQDPAQEKSGNATKEESSSKLDETDEDRAVLATASEDREALIPTADIIGQNGEFNETTGSSCVDKDRTNGEDDEIPHSEREMGSTDAYDDNTPIVPAQLPLQTDQEDKDATD